MKLTFPSTADPVGRLVLERGAQAGRDLRFEVSVCKNPVCQCMHITLHFLANDADRERGTQASRGAAASLELDLAKRRLHDFKVTNPKTETPDLGEAVVDEMESADWNGFRRSYVELKQAYTQGARLDTIEAEFPEEAAEGLTVGYYEILPYARPVEVPWDGRQWIMDDQYCVMPRCGCHYAVLAFFPLGSSEDERLVAQDPAATVRYDYRTGLWENVPEIKKPTSKISTVLDAFRRRTSTPAPESARVSVPAILEAFKRAKPNSNSFLADRHTTLRRLFQFALNRKNPPMQASKPARNAPCPCGSGKKYKRCCGGAARES